jgi:hypothetical protein
VYRACITNGAVNFWSDKSIFIAMLQIDDEYQALLQLPWAGTPKEQGPEMCALLSRRPQE